MQVEKGKNRNNTANWRKQNQRNLGKFTTLTVHKI